MPLSPQVIAFVLCDEIHRDPATRKTYLLGIFNQVMVREFPGRHEHMHVYLSLVNGHGKARAALAITCDSGAQVVFRSQGEIEFANPLAVVEMDFEIRNLLLPKEGDYQLELNCNDEVVAIRPFRVVGMRRPGLPGGSPTPE